MRPLTWIALVVAMLVVCVAWPLMIVGSVMQGVCALMVEAAEMADRKLRRAARTVWRWAWCKNHGERGP